MVPVVKGVLISGPRHGRMVSPASVDTDYGSESVIDRSELRLRLMAGAAGFPLSPNTWRPRDWAAALNRR